MDPPQLKPTLLDGFHLRVNCCASFAEPEPRIVSVPSDRLLRAVVDEVVAVEAAQPLGRAKPEEAVGVTDDADEAVVRQAGGPRVDPDRYALGGSGRARQAEQAEPAEKDACAGTTSCERPGHP